MTSDSGAFEVKIFGMKLTVVRSGVTPGGCGVTEASGQTSSCGYLSGRLSVAWTRATILMKVNFLTTIDIPCSSLVEACGREVRRVEFVEISKCLDFFIYVSRGGFGL